MPVYFPADPAIPAKAIPAEQRFERTFVRDKQLLQREQKAGVSPALTTIAYAAVLLVAALLLAALTAGLVRLARSRSEPSGRFARERDRVAGRAALTTESR
jgi:predicted small integral membrane protein